MSFFKALKVSAFFLLGSIALSACSGEDGKDGVSGADGKDAPEVNIDSLASALREEITGSLWDTLYAEPYVDTVYNILFDNAFASSWMDSVREALIDSLKSADFDSLYEKLYDSVYYDIYSKNVVRHLDGWVWSYREEINAAFADQYSLMYKDFKNNGEPYPVPVSIKARNQCDVKKESCRWNKVLLKAWIPGFTDTASVTGIVNPGEEIILGPTFDFDNASLAEITVPEKTQIQLRGYALENDKEILFYSESKPVTINPIQVYGSELIGIKNYSWYHAVWVTPNMDSITTIHKELEKILPGGQVKAYQLYGDDPDLITSSARLVQAVYNVLKDKGINYVNNTSAASIGQKIKYPVEVLRTTQANCIEGVNLFASILESLGMHTLIVTIPGHAFLGWYTNEEMTNFNFLETTMAWGKDAASFSEAYEAGMNEFTEQKESGNFESGKSEIISITEARQFGIMPNDIP